MNNKSSKALFSVPYWNDGLPRCDVDAAGSEIGGVVRTALIFELQTRVAELHMAAKALDVFAAFLVVLHLNATIGADPEGRDGLHPPHIVQRHGSTLLQQLQNHV